MSTDNNGVSGSELPETVGTRKREFVFGGTDDDEPELPLEEEHDEEEEEGDDPLEAEESGLAAVFPADMPLLEPRIDTVELTAAAELALQDPALRMINAISTERFGSRKVKADDGQRVTRGWLESLSQRHFFLAIGYPGTHLLRLLNGFASIAQIRSWCDGIESCPDVLRRLLTLEHLLDRRTLANRARMPSRRQIEDALRVMPKTGSVSEVVGGFDNISRHDLELHPQSKQIQEGTVDQVRSALRIVQPGAAPSPQGRRGAALPMNKRLLGKGRPMGQRLLKPDPYCYTISKKSRDELGNPRITPQQAMDLINKAADLENQHGTFYSLRRKDTHQPWSMSNIEFLPSDLLEEERGASLRKARDRE